MPRKKRVSTAQAAAVAAPEWLTEMPEPMGYEMLCYEPMRGELQTVRLSRREYFEILCFVARLRGYEVPTNVEYEPDFEPVKAGA